MRWSAMDEHTKAVTVMVAGRSANFKLERRLHVMSVDSRELLRATFLTILRYNLYTA